MIVMGLQPSSDAFAEILVQGSIVIEAYMAMILGIHGASMSWVRWKSEVSCMWWSGRERMPKTALHG